MTSAFERRLDYLLALLVVVLCAAAALAAREFQPNARWFPMFASIGGLVLALLAFVADAIANLRARWQSRTDAHAQSADPSLARHVPDSELGGPTPSAPLAMDEDEPPAVLMAGFLRLFAWFASFSVLFVLFSMPLGVFAWVTLFIRFAAGESWRRAALSAAVLTLLLILISAYLALVYPSGIAIDSSLIIPQLGP